MAHPVQKIIEIKEDAENQKSVFFTSSTSFPSAPTFRFIGFTVMGCVAVLFLFSWIFLGPKSVKVTLRMLVNSRDVASQSESIEASQRVVENSLKGRLLELDPMARRDQIQALHRQLQKTKHQHVNQNLELDQLMIIKQFPNYKATFEDGELSELTLIDSLEAKTLSNMDWLADLSHIVGGKNAELEILSADLIRVKSSNQGPVTGHLIWDKALQPFRLSKIKFSKQD